MIKFLVLIKERIKKTISLLPRYDILIRYRLKEKINILDVGCGYHSAELTRYYFPECRYYGLDKSNINLENLKKIKQFKYFWKIDLEKSNLNEIPNNFFDLIILSHVIEHLRNGEIVLLNLFKKLKKNGILYLEFPSFHTKDLPSLKRLGYTLNFYDDSTHIRMYTLKELKNFLIINNFKILKAGLYQDLKKIVLLPLLFSYFLIARKFPELIAIIWNLLGFCSFIVALKQ